ncbi:hypothetical protein [Mesorhizobium sp. M9A.F.Ca.ET.002.03.1.2]|uniref:hypothetical protein n=1 Tax=Mesorhizobium sp. M9A.F.Ca.ET.002.03.1.2 TaxID=2493668 RepID=UPI001672B36A|nr:hypothetical protein [Mesorhizobium sp. M9A.F.Ca.ET.002.03.1.2]
MSLDESAFRPLDEAIRQAFNGGGVATVEQMPALRSPSGFQIVVGWDARNVAAEAWLRDHSSTLIRSIVADQQESIRAALSEGLAKAAIRQRRHWRWSGGSTG